MPEATSPPQVNEKVAEEKSEVREDPQVEEDHEVDQDQEESEGEHDESEVQEDSKAETPKTTREPATPAICKRRNIKLCINSPSDVFSPISQKLLRKKQ